MAANSWLAGVDWSVDEWSSERLRCKAASDHAGSDDATEILELGVEGALNKAGDEPEKDLAELELEGDFQLRRMLLEIKVIRPFDFIEQPCTYLRPALQF